MLTLLASLALVQTPSQWRAEKAADDIAAATNYNLFAQDPLQQIAYTNFMAAEPPAQVRLTLGLWCARMRTMLYPQNALDPAILGALCGAETTLPVFRDPRCIPVAATTDNYIVLIQGIPIVVETHTSLDKSLAITHDFIIRNDKKLRTPFTITPLPPPPNNPYQAVEDSPWLTTPWPDPTAKQHFQIAAQVSLINLTRPNVAKPYYNNPYYSTAAKVAKAYADAKQTFLGTHHYWNPTTSTYGF